MSAPVTGRPGAGPSRWLRLGVPALGVLWFALYPLVVPDTSYYQTVLILTFMLAVTASGWNIISGFAGYVSLGQSAFIGIGGYTVVLLALWLDVDAILLFPLGGVAAGVVAALFGAVITRTRGHAFVIITIALLLVMETLARELRDVTGGSAGLSLPLMTWVEGDYLQFPFYYPMLLLVVASVVLSAWVRRTRLGAGLLAIREDEDKAAAIGIRTPVYKVLGFVASSVLIGMAGGVYAAYQQFADPASMFAMILSLQAALAAVLGGRGTVWGPVLGAFIIQPLHLNSAFDEVTGLRLVVFGALLCAAVLLVPDGIIPTARRWLARRRAAGTTRPRPPAVTTAPRESAPATGRLATRRPEPTGGRRVTPCCSDPCREPSIGRRVAPRRSDPGREPSTRPPLLELDGVGKRFGGLHVLDGCSFTVGEGTITGLIGPNGSGKTTAFNLVTGMLPVDSGEIRFDGRRIDRLPPWERHALGVGRTFQIPRLFKGLTVMENMVAPPGAFSWRHLADDGTAGPAVERARACLELVGMDAAAGERAGQLSFGQQKLVELAQVLMPEPKLILLDEPTGGVSPVLVDQMVALIRACNQRGTSFLVVEHNLPVVLRLCDPVVVLARGRPIAEGPPGSIRQDPAVLEAYLGGGRTESTGVRLET